MKNTGIAYEKLIEQLFKSMAEQEALKNINIQRNVVLKGKSGATHQIDVYWEFESLGINYKIIIEAKDYANRVTQEKLFAFKSVLDDIKGQPRGIYITKNGYQSGAKRFAEHHGIILYEFRRPTESDWKGNIRDICFDVVFNNPQIENLRFTIDPDWLKDFCIENNIKPSPNYNFSAYPNNVFFYDENCKRLQSVYEKINSLIKEHFHDNNYTNCIISHQFCNPTYLDTLDRYIPKLKITEIIFEIRFDVLKDKVEIYGDDIVKFILKNVLENSTKRIDSNMQIVS